MKKIISLLAVLVLIFSCSVLGLGTVASAAEESSADDFLVFDGILEEYVGDGGDVVIPASLGIKEIAAQAFHNNLDITSLIIPEGVKSIGYWSVKGCSNLERVELPYTLEKLAEHCLTGLAITEIVIPGNVDIIGYGVFSSCKYLESVTISYGVKEIQVLAFQGTAAHEVVFPETVALICGTSFVNLNYDGTYEYTICNPDCEIGPGTDNSAKAYKHQWSYTVSCPFNSAKYSVRVEFIVPKGSAVEAYLKSDEIKAKQQTNAQSKNDIYAVTSKDPSYFEQYGENWGMQNPAGNSNGNTSNQVNNNTNNTNNNTNNTNNNNNTNNTNNNNGNSSNNNTNLGSGTTSDGTNKNNSNGSTQTIITTQGGNNSSIITMIAIIGGVMLLAIIVVVILAATGVLFGKESAPKAEAGIDANDPEALKAALDKIEAEKNKIDPNDPEALTAALERLQNQEEITEEITEE